MNSIKVVTSELNFPSLMIFFQNWVLSLTNIGTISSKDWLLSLTRIAPKSSKDVELILRRIATILD